MTRNEGDVLRHSSDAPPSVDWEGDIERLLNASHVGRAHDTVDVPSSTGLEQVSLLGSHQKRSA